MSESTPIRTTKDITNCFQLQGTEEAKHSNQSEGEDMTDPNQIVAIPSYQEWRDSLMKEKPDSVKDLSSKNRSDKKQPPLSKVARKQKRNGGSTVMNSELVLGHSPKKIKNFAQLQVSSHRSKSPLTSRVKADKVLSAK